jgi:hypothetical protein
MKNSILIIFVLITYNVFCQGETAQQIANKLKPEKSKIVHTVIQQDFWGIKNGIIAFYETRYLDTISATENYERQFIEGYIIIPQKQGYRKVLINKYEDDNVDTEIESVFFANADKDESKELVIISTVTHRLQYLYDGTEYSTDIFNDFTLNNIPNELNRLDKLGSKFSGFEGYVDSKGTTKAKYKTAADVRRKLKQMGY